MEINEMASPSVKNRTKTDLEEAQPVLSHLPGQYDYKDPGRRNEDLTQNPMIFRRKICRKRLLSLHKKC